jgi:hypothetical protein
MDATECRLSRDFINIHFSLNRLRKILRIPLIYPFLRDKPELCFQLSQFLLLAGNNLMKCTDIAIFFDPIV